MSKENERLKTDCNVFIDKAINLLKDCYKDEWLIAGYNGVVCLLQYAKESHLAASTPVNRGEQKDLIKEAWEDGWRVRNKACGLSKATILKNKFEQWHAFKQSNNLP